MSSPAGSRVRDRGNHVGKEEGNEAKRSHIDERNLGSTVSGGLSTIDVALKISCYLLDTKLALQDAAIDTRETGGGGPCFLLPLADIPLPSANQFINFKNIYLKCSEKKLDKLQFSIACYARASGNSPNPLWDDTTWSSLALCAQKVTAEMALNYLIEGSVRDSGDDDLWSSLYGNEMENTTSVNFLERLSGWQQDETQFPPGMSQHIFSLAKDSVIGSSAVVKMMTAAGHILQSIKKLDDLLMTYNKLLDGLDHFFADVSVAGLVSKSLLGEVEEAREVLQYVCKLKFGDYFETKSFFSGLLSVSMVIDKLHPVLLKSEKYSCFVELRNFPNVSVTDAAACSTHLQDGFHHCQRIVHSALIKMLKSSNRNNVLAWMAAVVSLNKMRAGPRFRKEEIKGVCSDGFMLNFCAVLLTLCKPFFSNHTSAPKLNLISPSYSSSPACRLDLLNETCLAQGVITVDRNSEGHARFLGAAPPTDSGILPTTAQFKFVTECFFITQQALHVGLMPAMNTFIKITSDLARQLSFKSEGETERKEEVIKHLYTLYHLAWSCSLMDPQFVQHCCDFYITQAVWITKQIESCHQAGISEEEVHEKQRLLLSALPEFCIKDMASWFKFLAQFRPALLQGLQLTPMVDCCVGLLERPDLLPSPLTQSRIVSTLLVFVDSDKRGQNPQRLLGAESWGGILGELSVMVQGNPSVRDNLCPALLHTYTAVTVFEGLDVDKENFDKYSTRYEVARLLHRLWGRPDCRDSIIRECGSAKFQAFLGAVFDTLLYQLNDALSRLVNVRNSETAKDSGQWKSLMAHERREKEVFLASEKHASRGFMTQANKQLELLLVMSETEPVARCLSKPPLGRRTAAALLGFLNILCGPKASNLKVKDMEKYSFDPARLVTQISSILVQVWIQDQKHADHEDKSFAKSFVTHPDFTWSTMTKCLSVLQKTLQTDAELIGKFQSFLEEMHHIDDESTANLSSRSSNSSGADPAGRDDDWQEMANSLEIVEEDLCELYVAALEESMFDSAELETVHTLIDKAQVTLDPRSPMAKAVLRDMKQLQESILVHPDSAIFVRQDEDHLDLVRVMITGPTGSPYSRGCFVFDINYPASYPNNPPLVIMITTGGGTIRFNPNLYADGKVCLSLLGTWHGGDATEKWDPVNSNLQQVLLSIQGMIFIPDPMFNEPGYEAIRGTDEGNERSREYNADIQVYTVRYAMLEQLRNPPEGFKDTIPVHFALQRDAILKQCSQWLRDAISPTHEQKLRKAIDELRAEMDNI